MKPPPRDNRYCEECGSPLDKSVHHKVYTHNDINPSWPVTVHDECGVLQDPTLPPTDEKKYSPYPVLLRRVICLSKKHGHNKRGEDMLVLEVLRLKTQNLPDRTIIAWAFQRVNHLLQQVNFTKLQGDQHVG